jgi:hypothetical protein
LSVKIWPDSKNAVERLAQTSQGAARGLADMVY